MSNITTLIFGYSLAMTTSDRPEWLFLMLASAGATALAWMFEDGDRK